MRQQALFVGCNQRVCLPCLVRMSSESTGSACLPSTAQREVTMCVLCKQEIFRKAAAFAGARGWLLWQTKGGTLRCGFALTGAVRSVLRVSDASAVRVCSCKPASVAARRSLTSRRASQCQRVSFAGPCSSCQRRRVTRRCARTSEPSRASTEGAFGVPTAPRNCLLIMMHAVLFIRLRGRAAEA